MAKTKKGDFAAEKILETAKELFYEQGYYKTTVAEITKKAGVNNGLFTYYYGTKTNLSNIINAKFRLDFRNAISKNMFEIDKCYDMAVGIAVEYRKNLELLSKKPKLRRYTIEQNSDVMIHKDMSYEDIMNAKDSLHTSQRGHYYQLQKRLINPNISDIDLNVYQTAGVAATNALIAAMHDRIIDCSTDYMGDKFIEICFNLLKLPDEKIEELKEQSLIIAKQFDLTLKDYFIIE